MQAKLTNLLGPAFAAAEYVAPSSLIAAGPLQALQPPQQPCKPRNGTHKKLHSLKLNKLGCTAWRCWKKLTGTVLCAKGYQQEGQGKEFSTVC